MSFQTAADVPIIVASSNSSSERRISPSWSIAHLKSRLEPITGIPTSCQQLTLRIGSQDAIAITAADEEQTQLASFALQPYAEITVSYDFPPGLDVTALSPLAIRHILLFPSWRKPCQQPTHASDAVFVALLHARFFFLPLLCAGSVLPRL
jgi:hypothetical protein